MRSQKTIAEFSNQVFEPANSMSLQPKSVVTDSLATSSGTSTPGVENTF
jgi:hypothetical protein